MYNFIKRVLDIIISTIILILTIPFFIVIPIIIKKQSIGPIIFSQIRLGKNGKLIKIYKFRTMVKNAENLIKNFNDSQKKEYMENFKLINDYRVTKLGEFLRNTGIDELPQLINVIKGEMSLVGPRPVVQDEIHKYGESKDKILSVKPGLTGYWVANRTSMTTYKERIKMELYYVDNISLWLDIKIFIKTLLLVIKDILGESK